MPNEADLYSTDRTDAWRAPEGGYHTSRWVIPLAWLFLFRASDIVLADVDAFDGTASWREIRLRAEKDSALKLLADRRPLLNALIAGKIGEPEIDGFVQEVRGQPGPYLILDPSEVFGDDESDVPFFASILELIQEGDIAGLKSLDAVGSVIGGFRNRPDVHRGDVLGYYVRPGADEEDEVKDSGIYNVDLLGLCFRIDTNEL